MSNIYYRPESFGLRVFGDVDWSDGCYQFDMTVVWQDVTTGALYFADDSGCSCPSPFEDTGRDGLTPIDVPKTFIAHLNDRLGDAYNDSEKERAAGDSGELVMAVRKAMQRD